MAQLFQFGHRSITIPGGSVISTQCSTDGRCCPPDPIEPSPFDCNEPNLGTSLPQQVVVTLSNSDPSFSRPYLSYVIIDTPVTICGDDVTEAYLAEANAFPDGSYTLDYIGLFSGSQLNQCKVDSFTDTCNYHIYALSQSPVPSGEIGVDPSVTDLDAVAFCCCDHGGHLYLNRSTDEVTPEYVTGSSLCADIIGPLKVPCDVGLISLRCQASEAGLIPFWISHDVAITCAGSACSGGPPNADVLAGLICDGPGLTLTQYPFRVRYSVLRQMVFAIPQNSEINETCCGDGLLLAHAYVMRRRWLDDGSSLVQAEPALFSFTRSGPITFDSSGSISGFGEIGGFAVCSACMLTPTQDVEIDAA